MTTAKTKPTGGPVSRAAFREVRFEVEEFYFEYAATLERGDIESWPEFFTEDANYRVIARDNADHGLPLGLIYCEGKAMLKDRAFALLNTEMYAPRYLQLRIANTRILGVEGDTISAEASYLLLQTLVEEPTTIQQAGKYRDLLVRNGETLLIRDRECVYDTVIINNNLVFPV